MGSYKSLVTVGAMGAVLVVLAGMLLDVERAKIDKQSKVKTEEAPSRATVIDGSLVFLDGRKEKGDDPPLAKIVKKKKSSPALPEIDFAAELTDLRRLMGQAGKLGPDALRVAEAKRKDLSRFADRETYPLIEAELRQPQSPKGLRRILVLLAAETGHPRAVPMLESAYSEMRVSALEALGSHGGPEAFAAFLRLAEKAGGRAEKFAFARTLKNFDLPASQKWALDWLAKEEDIGVACELATQMRHFSGPGLVPSLVQQFRIEIAGEGRSRVAGRIANSLAVLPKGPKAIHQLLIEEVAAEVLILGPAFERCRAPELVPVVADSIPVSQSTREAQLRFLERNASAEHFDLLEVACQLSLGEEAHSRLEALCERLSGS
jgi:hypothetical protein